MEKLYVIEMQYRGELEQENCGTGLVPADCAMESYENGKTQEISYLF